MRPERSAKDAALSLLARRDHSSAELRQKLAARGYARADIDALVPRLLELGLLDDRRMARLLVERELASGASGPARIKARLFAKGIAPDLIDECFGALTHEWELNQARHAASAWCARHRAKNAWRESLARHLRARGFGWEAIRTALQSVEPRRDDGRESSYDEP
ncbi:RecX family transcriptional regulator [Candidatus Fermentibacteria bacterium]|nr:RecX family transcriptional regulator [Candidatus Fermentibacteria bacterium]